MRKFLNFSLVVVTIFLSFLLVGIADATSGACSSHGGVNCSAGANSSGDVVCNDGWSNSSVSYYSADECRASCIPPSGSGCKTESDYAARRTSLITSGGYLGHSSSMEGALNQCRNEINQYQSESQAYNSCLAQGSGNSYGSGNLYSSFDTTLYVNDKMQIYCTDKYGSRALFDTDKQTCNCQSGYAFDPSNKINPKCVPEKQAEKWLCVTIINGVYDPSVSEINQRCVCGNGYYFNKEAKQCELQWQTVGQKPLISIVDLLSQPQATTSPVQLPLVSVPKPDAPKAEPVKIQFIKATTTEAIQTGVSTTSTTSSAVITTTTPEIIPVVQNGESFVGRIFLNPIKEIFSWFSNLF